MMYTISYCDLKTMDTIIYAKCKDYQEAKEKYKEIKNEPFAIIENSIDTKHFNNLTRQKMRYF